MGISIRSIIGIPPMIAPVAMIGSASVLIIAAGACPFRSRHCFGRPRFLFWLVFVHAFGSPAGADRVQTDAL